jgi:hypothetical protein
LRAMAELVPGSHRSGGIAELLGREVTSLAPTRSQSIAKGKVWSPGHGDTAFTVPFRRVYAPNHAWRGLEIGLVRTERLEVTLRDVCVNQLCIVMHGDANLNNGRPDNLFKNRAKEPSTSN